MKMRVAHWTGMARVLWFLSHEMMAPAAGHAVWVDDPDRAAGFLARVLRA